MLTWIRLARFYRKGGATRRQALKRAWQTARRNLFSPVR